jgi:ABC-type Fe3+-hydroxamate transport system substrate-binding protein
LHSYRFVPYVAFIALACATGEHGARPRAATIVDDFGDTVAVGAAPQRIVSLNPATTELVFAIGAGTRLAGRSHWDNYPDSAKLVADLGNAMRPNVEAVLAAHPDIVLLYASADNRPARDALHRAGIATLSQRFDRVSDFAAAVQLLGRVLGDSAQAKLVVDTVLASLERARALTKGLPRPKVFWPMWESPLLATGHGSFFNDLLEAAGATNIFGDLAAPSPQVSFEAVVKRDPDFVMAGETNGPLTRIPRWQSVRAVRTGHILVYDTLMVGRPGVRLGEAAMHLAKLLHPELAAQR